MSSKNKRIDRDDYYMELAKITALRSTCDRAHVGAIAVKDRRVIMTGYNGSIAGHEHCDEVGHYIVDGHCIRTVHAEQNIITQCAKNGISLQGATLYVTHHPCNDCLKLLISAGIEVIFYLHYKPDERITKELKDSIMVRTYMRWLQ